jgi:hypothetical protein
VLAETRMTAYARESGLSAIEVAPHQRGNQDERADVARCIP